MCTHPPIAYARTIALSVLALVAAAVADARAQALLPAKGEGYASFLYSNVYMNRHLLPVQEADIGEIDSNSLLFDATYGLSDRVAVSIGLPLVISRYQGVNPHQPDNPDRLDDGDWHATFQDVRFAVRYNVIRGAAAVTPFIGTSVPSHAYEYWAHAAPGRRLREIHAGVAAAKLLDDVVPGLFLQGRYSFAVAERVLDIRPRRSNLDVELGYFLSPEVRVFGMASAQKAHSGIDLFPGGVGLTVLQRQHHDQLGRDEFVNVGGGTSVSLNETLDLFGAFMKQIAGRNGHKINRAVSVGVTWSFRRRPSEEIAAPTAPSEPHELVELTPARKSLLRCLCQKTGG